MDSLRRGGEDSIRNAVYVCDTCNLKKADSSFLEWLRTLSPEYQRIARSIYAEKHGHPPEDFKEGEPVERVGGWAIELDLTENELKEMYPEPIVDGPPSDAEFSIHIELGEDENNGALEEG
jgi:hypothetical protein